ncbi:MAG: glucokinase [Paracoccaceae bacterium]
MTEAPLNLVADVGGTNTRVALARGATLMEGTIRRFRNADNASMTAVLRSYLAEAGVPPCDGACVAVAGPVKDGTATLTNLDWTIDDASLAGATGAPRTAIINDLQAQGFALGHIADEKLRRILPGQPAAPDATRLVIGVGTGFNAAPVHETPWGRHIAASECGHESLPVRTDTDLALARYVERDHGFPGIEDALSGRGLERVYAFTAETAGKASGLEAAAIMAGAQAGDALARTALAHVVRLLGTVAGDLALVHLPFGGIFLCGGVARALTPWLDPMGFAAAFADKGRFSDYLRQFPVHVIEDDYAALTGCARRLSVG